MKTGDAEKAQDEQLDDSEHIIAALVKERDEARAACTLAWQRICAERRWAYDPAMDPVEALRSRLDPGSVFYEAFNLDSSRLREALEGIVVIGEQCNCSGYGGPCGCGDRAEDRASEALKGGG